MDLPGYVALTRATGLLKTMQAVANNIANVSTTGFRREGVLFAEMVEALPAEGGSVAMTAARGRVTSQEQGALVETGGALDMAIEGEGYFTVLTPEGERLTRAGAFARSPDGEIVDPRATRCSTRAAGPSSSPSRRSMSGCRRTAR